MQEDRFFSAFKSCVTRVLEDAAAVDYTATYAARVAAYNTDAGTPSGTVDVQFTDGIAAQKLVSINAVPLLPPWPGLSYVPTVGSQVVVGWLGGDERSPWAASWSGQGAVTSLKVTASTDGQNTIEILAPAAGSTLNIQASGSGSTADFSTGAGGSTTIRAGGGGHVDVTADVVNLGAAAGTLVIVLQPIVVALTTVLTAVGSFATAVGVAVPGVAGAAVTLNTAIATFASGSSRYTTLKAKAA